MRSALAGCPQRRARWACHRRWRRAICRAGGPAEHDAASRTTRRFALIPAGADYLDRTERILAELSDADAEAAAPSGDVEGLLRISAPATFGTMYVASLAAAFRDRHPRATVELGLTTDTSICWRSDRILRSAGNCPTAAWSPAAWPPRFAIHAAPSHLARRGIPRTLLDLSDRNCLGHAHVSRTDTLSGSFGREGTNHVPMTTPIRADDGKELARAVGQGLVYGPTFIAAPLVAAGDLVAVTLDSEPMDLGAVHAITHPTRRPSAKTRAWITFLVKRMPALAQG